MDTKMVLVIVDGPSKDRLFDACKYAYEKNPIEVDFKFDPPDGLGQVETKNLKITSIEHEDGSGFSLNFNGYIDAKPSTEKYFLPYRITAYYNTKSRKGHISFLSNT